jgi:hypothetical protein
MEKLEVAMAEGGIASLRCKGWCHDRVEYQENSSGTETYEGIPSEDSF